MKITGFVAHYCILVMFTLACCYLGIEVFGAWAGGENLMDTGHELRNANDI